MKSQNSRLKGLTFSMLIIVMLLLAIPDQIVAQDEPAATEEEADADNFKWNYVLKIQYESGKTERMKISYNERLNQWEFYMPATGGINGLMNYNRNENIIDLYFQNAHFGELHAQFSGDKPKDVDEFLDNGTKGGGTLTAGEIFLYSIISKKRF